MKKIILIAICLLLIAVAVAKMTPEKQAFINDKVSASEGIVEVNGLNVSMKKFVPVEESITAKSLLTENINFNERKNGR